jgi:hypothetical protein
MEAGRKRVLLFIATFCVLPLLGVGFYLIVPTVPGETVTTQVTITTRMVDTGTSYLTASVVYTVSTYTSLCNYLGPPYGCGSLRTNYATASYSTAIAAFTSTQPLVTTSSSQTTLAPHAPSQTGGIAVIMAAIIIAAALVVAWKRRAQPPSLQSAQPSARPRGVIPVKSNMQFCDYCGARIPVDSTFCEECGAHLKSTGSSFVQTSRGREPSVSRRGHVAWDGSRATADYTGWCPRCHRRIRPGDEITWWKDDTDDVKWIHLKCR